MTQRIVETIEEDRKDLLDLTLRNTLLNFRLLKTRGVAVTDASPRAVYEAIVIEGRTLSFVPRPDQQDEIERHELGRLAFDADEPEGEKVEKNRKRETELQTSHSEKRLETRLLNTYYAARTTIEELGINTLYLALGGLRWFEDAQSDRERFAPLLLIPVEISRASVRARFRIRNTGDEIGTNLSLQHKLKADFRIDLPDIETDNDFDFEAYLRLVASAIADQPRWSVDHEAVHLGFFSFTKLLMFEDLDPAHWFREGEEPHPVLRGLLDGDLSSDPPDPLADASGLDERIDLAETRHIWDSDSSQAMAVADAMADKSLVIQGPPGTGKSQTITNLIAEAIVAGKTVLFVAEKMAALEVVQRRLATAGVGAACLELHSHKSSKKAVLEELRKTIRIGRPQGTDDFEDAADLRELRDRLNAYCDEVHRPILESNVSPFKAVAETLRLRRTLSQSEPPALSIDDLATWDPDSYRIKKNAVLDLEPILRDVGPVRQHPFWGARLRTVLPQDEARIRDLANESSAKVRDVIERGRNLASALDLPAPQTVQDVGRALDVAARWQQAPDLSGLSAGEAAWKEKSKLVSQVLDLGERAAGLRREHERELLPDAWAEDVLEIRKTLAAYRAKWWRWAVGEYRSANRAVTGLYRDGAPRSLDQRIEAVDAILESRRLIERAEQFLQDVKPLIGPRWRGLDTDWASLRVAAAFLADIHEAIAAGRTPREILALLGRTDLDAPDLAAASGETQKALSNLEPALAEIIERLQLDLADRWETAGIEQVPLVEWQQTLETWAEKLHLLQPLVSLNSAAERLRGMGLEPLVSTALTWPGAPSHLADLLDLRRHEALLGEALAERRCLREFVAASHESALDRFRTLDEELLQTNRRLVALSHYDRIPQVTAGGQVGVLRHEFEKKRRHLSVRKLLLQAGEAVQATKPVFMMSPLSVAAYLPPDGPKFDLVIFDEASQVRPVDAYGAILRGRQCVVVGDSKQLPPTPFFDRFLEADEEDGEGRQKAADLESVLGLFQSKGAPRRMLRWHYRSRHDDLIRVSNREFYNDRLIVFPTPERDSEATGLFFHHLDKAFYRSGRGGGYNPAEAEEVARAVMRHAEQSPALTLGVAAFSHRQAQEIRDQLEMLRRKRPELEPYFSSHPEEPFFVKNLENVQGDERHVIFISIGYGRREDGILSHNFGPLNLDGGERRLNVLISRARRRCEVFSNIRGDDLDLRKSQSRGVQALKTFLQFAETRRLATESLSGRPPDSVFEEEVAERLRQQGWEADPQVGSCGFFVDIGVRDPARPGRYILGIECDGASYHSSAWARDRDRLRQAALEKQGWKIHRIWSTDWFRNEEGQVRKILEKIEWARQRTEDRPGPDTSARPDPNASPSESVPREEPTAPEDLAGIPYREAEPRVRLRGEELHRIPKETMAQWVLQVVDVESPVHFDEVAWRITTAAGLGRVGRRIRTAVQRGVWLAVSRDFVKQEGRFLWRRRPRTVTVRDRSELPSNRRKIDLVAPEEIAEAVTRIVSASFSIPRDEAIQSCARMLGFARTGHHISEGIEAVLDGLVHAGRLCERDGNLVPSEKG